MEFDDDAVIRGWTRHEIRRAVEGGAFDVDPSLVSTAVSARATRRAGACRHVPLPGGAVGEAVAWDGMADARRHRETTVVLARRAAAAFDEVRLRDVLRHELVHVEQVQAYGVTDHGAAFRERAAELDVPLSCPPFADPAYVLRCPDCERVVGRRYRRCPTVESPGDYRTGCCGATPSVESNR